MPSYSKHTHKRDIFWMNKEFDPHLPYWKWYAFLHFFIFYFSFLSLFASTSSYNIRNVGSLDLSNLAFSVLRFKAKSSLCLLIFSWCSLYYLMKNISAVAFCACSLLRSSLINIPTLSASNSLCRPKAKMRFTRSPLPQNNGNLPLPFFGGNYPIVLLDNIY